MLCAEESIASFIVSKNLERRHLNESHDPYLGRGLNRYQALCLCCKTVGVSHMTVKADLEGVRFFTPEITGKDGKTYLRNIFSLSPEKERQLALDLNTKRRHLSGEERAAAVLRLRQEGQSTRQIAEILGVAKSTIARDLSTVPNGTVALPTTITGKDGKERAATTPRLLISTREESSKRATAMYDAAESKVVTIQSNARRTLPEVANLPDSSNPGEAREQAAKYTGNDSIGLRHGGAQ